MRHPVAPGVRWHHLAAFSGAVTIFSVGCSVDLSQVFSDTGASGAGNNAGTGGTGGAGGLGGDGGSTTSATGSTTSNTTSSTTSVTSTTTTTTTTTTTSGPVCGNGTCDPGENSGNCAADCAPGACSHPVCQFGQALVNGCSDCVSDVCAQEPSCCNPNESWHGGCIGWANQLCGNLCCGDGQCTGEDCNNCTADCGTCPPEPTCPHRICFGGNNARPLNTTNCHDPCIDEVCAVIDTTTDNCCEPEPPAWSAECTALAKSICGEYQCIKDICAAMPSCCTTAWSQGCVNLAVNTPSCNTECNCDHGVCSDGGALDVGCDPCVDAVCAADPYCCNSGWDGICVGEVGTLCGIICN